MDNYFIEGTADSPEIDLNFKEQRFIFAGRSLPENPNEIYSPVIQLINQFLLSKPEKLNVDFKFEYFNTASSKKIFEVLDLLANGFEDRRKLSINWCYLKDDEDIREAGEDMQELTAITFNFKEI